MTLILIWANEVFYNFFELISLCLNLWLCYDLVLTLSNPFEVSRNRLSKYIFVSTAVSLIFTLYIFIKEDIHCTSYINTPSFFPLTTKIYAIFF